MSISISLSVAGTLDQRGDGVSEVEGHRFAGRGRGVGRRCSLGVLDRIGFGGPGQVNRGLGQRERGPPEADQVGDLRRGGGL